MEKKRLNDRFYDVTASSGMLLRRKGADPAADGAQSAIIASDQLDSWEEVPAADIEAAKAERKATLAYETDVEARIRTRYSVSQELAILRQRDTKPEEFAEYNAFAEECKAEAKKVIGQSD